VAELVEMGKSSTPHARGSTLSSGRMKKLGDVYPACAGIHPELIGALTNAESLPRMRGDPPQVCPTLPGLVASTPHARGSTARETS